MPFSSVSMSELPPGSTICTVGDPGELQEWGRCGDRAGGVGGWTEGSGNMVSSLITSAVTTWTQNTYTFIGIYKKFSEYILFYLKLGFVRVKYLPQYIL